MSAPDQAGALLRDRREALGLTLEDMAQRTRIGREHILAIEQGRLDELPPGPYRQAWSRVLHEALGLEEPEEEPEPVTPAFLPLAVVRAVGLISVFAVIGLVGWLQFGERLRAPAGPVVEPAPQLQVGVTARRTVRVAVTVDGEPAFEGELAGGESRTWEARQILAIDVPAVDAVRLSLGGETLVPQGRQDAPRRIVFTDDGGR